MMRKIYNKLLSSVGIYFLWYMMKGVEGGMSVMDEVKGGCSTENSIRLERRHGDHGHRHHNNEQGSGDDEVVEFEMTLHILAIFLLILVSGLGCGFTALSQRLTIFRIPKLLMELGRHFGSGVILATGFVHMLTGAMLNLTHPNAPVSCQGYTALAPLLALVAGLFMHLLELMVGLYYDKNPNQDSYGVPDDVNSNSDVEVHHEMKPLTPSHSHSHSHNFQLDPHRDFTTYMLELGILSHSIFIGISLGIATGPPFLPLLLAILFHQFFEGIGLGARIAELPSPTARPHLLMVITFSVTTSLGLFLGLLLRTSFSPTSPLTLLTTGIFDAISAGILIYTGLVDLLARECSPHGPFGSLPRPQQLYSLLALYGGIVAMAVIGIWA